MAKEPLHLDFSDAETQRNRLSEAQAKSIRDLYREASKEVGRWAERAPRVPSDALRKEYLNRLQGEINRELRGIERQLDGTVRNNMTEVFQATGVDAKAFAQNFGLSIQGAYSHVPTEIVRAVASGQLYEGNWTLSRALWLNTVETQRDVQNIVAKGILENRSAYDIAKDLEKYVNPDARKDWDWSKVYPGTRKVIDYNAQRLARTMVSHAYQQAFVRTTQKNPFITKYEWRAAETERTCQLCLDRDGQYFAKDDLPLDHPNGMCTFLAVIEDDFNTIADRLADWANGNEDSALDDWAKDLYGKDWESKKETPDYSSFQDAAIGAENKYEFWMNMTEEQQNQIKASGIDLGELFNQVKNPSSIQEWKPAAPGDSSSFNIKHDFSTHPLKFESVQARSAGWMADATTSGLIRVREDGLGSTWDFIISHEAGHQLSNASPELQQIILMNPGNILGRYNIKQGFFDGVYGEYNPEEAFATSVSNYVRNPDSMKEKYPDTYAAIDTLFKASPTAEQYVRSAMTQYEERFKP